MNERTIIWFNLALIQFLIFVERFPPDTPATPDAILFFPLFFFSSFKSKQNGPHMVLVVSHKYRLCIKKPLRHSNKYSMLLQTEAEEETKLLNLILLAIVKT